MWSTIQCIGGFVNRNRNKILVASAVAIGVSLYLNYNTETTEDEDKCDPQLETMQRFRLANETNAMEAANRTKLLFKIRRQFDSSVNQFIPTLRVKIVEVIDINGTVRHIKELRAKATTNKDELETRLWTEIKDSSFAMLIVTSYMLSAVCVLLRIQLHILARSLQKSYNNQQQQQVNNDDDIQLNSDTFRALIEGTYKHLYGNGLKIFSDMIKTQISIVLKNWTVKDKLHVSYDELLEVISMIRRNIENDISLVIKTIFIPPESASLSHTIAAEGNGNTPTQSTSSSTSTMQQNLLDQTWDLLESPAFQSVFLESVDRSFQYIHRELYSHIFHTTTDTTSTTGSSSGSSSSSSSNTPTRMKTPPLASILPQIKAISLKTLSESKTNDTPTTATTTSDANMIVSNEIRDISSGPYLEAFCLAIFDTPLR